MEKVEVLYSGGMSRYIPEGPVDYMLAQDPDWDTELYAEYPAQDDENANYELLKADILAQAEAQGIPVDSLRFFFDEDFWFDEV